MGVLAGCLTLFWLSTYFESADGNRSQTNALGEKAAPIPAWFDATFWVSQNTNIRIQTHLIILYHPKAIHPLWTKPTDVVTGDPGVQDCQELLGDLGLTSKPRASASLAKYSSGLKVSAEPCRGGTPGERNISEIPNEYLEDRCTGCRTTKLKYNSQH